jgi:hypothetical protein
MHVLADALEVDVANPKLFFSRLADVLDLPAQIREAVEHSPGVPDVFIQFLPEMQQYLQNLVNSLSNPGVQVPPPTLIVAMNIGNEMLSLQSPEQIPDIAELFEVRDDLKQLLDDVVTADIDSDLAQFISNHLHEVLDAIDRFTISGIAPIQASISHLVGDLQLKIGTGAMVERTDAEKKVGSRMWDLVSRLADLVNITAGSSVISAVVIQALTSGRPH